MDRTIVILTEGHVNAAISHISNNWKAMAVSGHPMAVRMYEHKERRSLEQQAVMWIRLGEIADQVWVEGKQYSAEVWHEQAKREYLPDEEGPTKRCRKGYRKWDYMPNEERVLVGSTTQLTIYGMAEYETQLEVWAAGMGVKMRAIERKS